MFRPFSFSAVPPDVCRPKNDPFSASVSLSMAPGSFLSCSRVYRSCYIQRMEPLPDQLASPDCSLLVILGPTASGKTRLAVRLAERLCGEILSADSRQVYRGLDLGAGKDLSEYDSIPYHLIDVVDPGQEFNVFEYQRLFIAAFEDIRARDRMPVLVGGTGLYLDAVLKGYRLVPVPENPGLRAQLANFTNEQLVERLRNATQRLHNSTDLLDRNRIVRAIEIAEFEREHEPGPFPELQPIVFGIRLDRQTLRRRITERLKERLSAGLVAEVEGLLNNGVSHETLEFFGLEYRFVARHIRGELSMNDMFQKLNSAIHDFAKRQDTWFRRMERNGTDIRWLDGDGDMVSQALNVVGNTARRPRTDA